MVSAGNQCSGEDLDLVPKCPTAASPLQFHSTSFCKRGKYIFQEVHIGTVVFLRLKGLIV